MEPKICDKIINYFETQATQYRGVTSHGFISNNKVSTDATFLDEELYLEYFTNLQKIFDEYKNIYPMVNYYSPWGITENVNIQRYNPAEGYFAWHSERVTAHPPDSTRHMVFMTYLNNISDGGETEFYHQELKVKPEKGLTLVWPADWTFTHRGCVSNTETKYIITGWANYQ